MTKDSPTIGLTKIKQWYLPVDAEAYNMLKQAGVPLTRIHERIMPALRLLTNKHKIKARLVDFMAEIYNPFMDRIGATWNKHENRICSLRARELRFETVKQSAYTKAKAALPHLEECLRRFFDRWGYKAIFTYSESRGKIRFVVNFHLDANKEPIIPLVEPPAEAPVIRFKLGFTRISIRLGKPNQAIYHRTRAGNDEDSVRYMVTKAPEVEIRIEVSQGGKWAPIHTSTCLYSQISSVAPVLLGMAQIVNVDPTNLDTEYTET